MGFFLFIFGIVRVVIASSVAFLFFANIVYAQVVTMDDREELAFEYIEDSCAKYININLLDRKPLVIDDRIFKYSDTTCIHYTSPRSKEVRIHCYPDFDNYVFRYVGDSISNEFRISNQEVSRDTFTWSFSRLVVDDNNDSNDSLDIDELLTSLYEGAGSWISLPVFNKNCDLMIVEYGHICGMLCGYGVTILYEFKNGKWNKKKILAEWVS